MLGRPAICEPVFMNMCAGSWLIASVVIERTTQISSITEPMCGNSSLTSVPFLPNVRNGNIGARQTSFWPWSCASCCPRVNDSGMGWPSTRARPGLGSNVSNCDGPPAIVSQMTRFAFWGNARKGGVRLDGWAWARRSDGSSSEASATAPTPCAARPRKARRWIERAVGPRRVLIVSRPRDRFVEVEQNPCDMSPGGKLGGVEPLGRRRDPDRDQGAGGGGIGAIIGQVLVEQLADGLGLGGSGGALERELPGPVQPVLRAARALAEHPRGEDAGGLDIGWII